MTKQDRMTPAGSAKPMAAEMEEIRVRVRAFVGEHILPVEDDRANWDEHDNIRLEALEPLRVHSTW